MRSRAVPAFLVWLSALAPLSAQDQPLSAIPWLSDSLNNLQTPLPGPKAEVPVGPSDIPDTISVSTIGAALPDAIGLFSARTAGLDPNLWGPSSSEEIARLLLTDGLDLVPALQALQRRLLIAELKPPVDADATGVLFRARIDKLLENGAVEDSLALLERASSADPEIFRRQFDVALLAGTEDYACQRLAAHHGLSPTYPVRIFCLARLGDWNSAVLTLNSARALELVSEGDADLLSRFLDPELFEGEPLDPSGLPMTPLRFRLLDAIGEPVATTDLPRAFAFADLESSRGWKAQIEAAERLTRAGALDPARLVALYTERRPAASGGIWERASALQDLEAALGIPADLATALPKAEAEMDAVGLTQVLASFLSGKIETTPTDPVAAASFHRLALLGPGYETHALDHLSGVAEMAFLAGIATGNPDLSRAPDPRAKAIAEALTETAPPERFAALLKDGRQGEAILLAMAAISEGNHGEFDKLRDGLGLLHALGLEDISRRTALQLLLLTPPA